MEDLNTTTSQEAPVGLPPQDTPVQDDAALIARLTGERDDALLSIEALTDQLDALREHSAMLQTQLEAAQQFGSTLQTQFEALGAQLTTVTDERDDARAEFVESPVKGVVEEHEFPGLWVAAGGWARDYPTATRFAQSIVERMTAPR